jgi:phosphate starvation-inducible membrane PsiE
LNDKLQRRIDKLGEGFIDIFHVIGLFMVSITIAWSAFHEYVIIINGETGFASLKDILLLFIYLELAAMTGIYFKTHRLPVVFLIFIAITAITRFMVIDMKHLITTDKFNLLIMVISILILSISAGILQFNEDRRKKDSYKNSDDS